MNYFEVAKKVKGNSIRSISPLREKAFIENCISRLNKKVKIHFINDAWCSKLFDSAGIYLFWAKFANYGKDLSDFQNKWKSAKESISYYPQFNKKRALQTIKQYKSNQYLPFYLGKSENIRSRVKQHIFLDGNKTTYALKLKAICEKQKSIGQILFFVSQLSFPFSNESYFLLNIVETELRNKLNPIIGEQ